MSDHLGRLEAIRWTGAFSSPHYSGDSSEDGRRCVADIAALCAECRQLRQDNAAYAGLFHDLQEDDGPAGRFHAGVGHGAARQLAECAAFLRKTMPNYNREPEVGVEQVERMEEELGPLRPPLPAERLEAENAELREALARLRAEMARPETGYVMD